MARLDDTCGRWLELTPLRYQFDWQECEYIEDANWLMIRFAIHDGVRTWGVKPEGDPALESWEADNLVSLLRGVLHGRVGHEDQSWGRWHTLERLIELEASLEGGVYFIDVLLNGTFLPPSDEPPYHHADPLRLEFQPPVDSLRTFAKELEDELRPFPQRGVRDLGLARRRMQRT